jgi:putative transposase
VKFSFVAAEKANFPVSLLCRVVGVSRSGFYAWQGRPPSAHATEDKALAGAIAIAHRQSRGTYGSPRVHAVLRAEGHRTSRKRVIRLMQAQHLAARRRRRFRRTTQSKHGLPVADNVLGRQFEVAAPNVAWVTDITYVPTREGWLYLATIVDLFSRRVVGWSMSASLETAFCLDALAMALRTRKPSHGLVHHSDRGCQYASAAYRKTLEANGLVCSMSRKGNCWDNAVAESFFATLKGDLVDHADFATRAEARAAIFKYIEVFYNRQRRHSHLGYQTPAEFEEKIDKSITKAA